MNIRLIVTIVTLSWSERIVLSDNNLFSTMPTELGLLSQLEYLDLGSNQLTGTIPVSLGSLNSLGTWNCRLNKVV